MDWRIATARKVQHLFREVNGSDVFMSPSKADYNSSIVNTAQRSLSMLNYPIAFVLINRNDGLKDKIKGKGAFLDSEGANKLEPGYHWFDDNGNLIKGRGHPERTVLVIPGNKPLYLRVCSDPVFEISGRRYELDATGSQGSNAPMILGVRMGYKLPGPEIGIVRTDQQSIKIVGIDADEVMSLQRNAARGLSELTQELETRNQDGLANTARIGDIKALVDALRIRSK